MEKKKMKPSDKIGIEAVVVAALLTGGLYWWISDMHWGVYLGFFILCAGGLMQGLTKSAAHRKIVDHGHPKD